MLSDAIIRRYLRNLILAVALIVSVLAFVWVNFLYTRFTLDTQKFAELQEEAITTLVEQRAGRVLLEGDRSYQQEYEELKGELRSLSTSLRSSVFDIYYTHSADPETLQMRLEELIDQLEAASGFDLYVSDTEYNVTYGDKPEAPLDLESYGYTQDAQMLYYTESLRYPSGSIVVSTDSDAEVRQRMVTNLSKYLELDPSILVFDEAGMNLNAHAQPKNLIQLAQSTDQFHRVETSELSGFTFGYAMSRDDLDLMIANRKILFSGFLQNHLWELAGFFVILFVAAWIVYHLFSRSLRKDQAAMSAILLEAYEGKTQLTQEPLFRYYSLTPTLNSIFQDVREKEEALRMSNEELRLNIKRQQVRLLSLERRIQSISGDSKFTEGVILGLRQEEFSLLDLIRKTHEEIDPTAPVELRGEAFLLESDPDLLEGILRDFFSLTDSEERRYVVEILRFENQLQIYFSLTGTDVIDQNVLEHLKHLARNLEGTLLRDMPTSEGLHLSLRFPLGD